MSEAKRTPGPWSIYKPKGKPNRVIGPSPKVIVANVLPGFYGGVHHATANAEFIARACNSHDDLLDALKDAISGLAYIVMRYGELEGVGWDRVNAASAAAIAKAEGLER